MSDQPETDLDPDLIDGFDPDTIDDDTEVPE